MNATNNLEVIVYKNGQIGTSDLSNFKKEFDYRLIGSTNKERFMLSIKNGSPRGASTFRSQIARAWAQILQANKSAH